MQSKLLTTKSEEEILEPIGVPFSLGGKTYTIKPMPDSLLITLADETSKIVALFDTISATQATAEAGMRAIDWLQLLPEILRLLLPNATKIIVACLGVPMEVVAAGMPLGKKMEALRLIVEQEDFPLLVKNFEALTVAFSPELPAETTND